MPIPMPIPISIPILIPIPMPKVKVKYLYLYWITLPVTRAVLPESPIRAMLHGSSVTPRGNRSTRRKPAMLSRVKLDNTLLTCDQGNFHQITARSRNSTLATVVRDTCTTTDPPAPRSSEKSSTHFWPHTKLLLKWWSFSLSTYHLVPEIARILS